MVFGLFGGGDDKKKKEGESKDRALPTGDDAKKATPKKKPAKVKSTAPGYASIDGSTALVTGSSGLCGARLVEMLLARGAKKVICFDLTEPSKALQQRFETALFAAQKVADEHHDVAKPELVFCHGKENGDITSDASVEAAFGKVDKIDCVYHLAALVGPFFDKDLYYAVNYHGTLRVIEMCKKYKVPKLVYVIVV